MAAVIENRLGSYEKRKEQVRRYELFIETNNSTGDTNKKPRLEIESKKSKYKIRFPDGCVFLAACSSGSTEDVAELLKNPNTDINTTNVDGLTGLHQACINEDIDMVKFLVDKGIDINMRDNEGWTALHAAAQSGFIEIAKFLINRGARLDLINCDCELPIDLSQTKSMTQLLEEAMKEQGIDGNRARNAEERMMMEDIGKWNRTGIYEGTADERTGATPLHVAAVKGYQEIMKRLIQLGAPVDAVDNEGWTPMHGAAHWGQEEACRLLAESYCDLRAVNHQGNTPLDVADPNVVGLLEELLEKQKSLPDNTNVSRPSNKIRKSSITRISAGQMKDLQRKNEEDEKPPMMPSLPVSEDDDSFGDSDQNKTVSRVRPIEEEGQTGDGQVMTHIEVNKFQDQEFEGMKPDVKGPSVTDRSDNKPEEVLSEDRIQFLLEERKKKLGQQRASDSNVVMMRRDVPRPKCNSEISRPRLIASDLMRRSGDPSLWRLAYRRSSNSENDIDVEGLVDISDEQIKKETGETDEDKELKRSREQSPDTQQHQQQLEPIKEVELSNQQSSLLRPETAAALASIASSHQRLTDNSKRDESNELERKLKAKRARESRRSTQGVTKEDIQRAEDTLKAAYQGQSKNNPLSTDTSTVPNPPEGGSGDVDCGQNFFVPHAHPASESQGGGMIDSSVATIIEKWQKKDGEVVVKGDLRAPVGSRGSVLGSPALNKKDYSPDTLILYRKISEQSQDNLQREASNQQTAPAQSSDTCQSKEGETGEDPVVKMAASRSRRKRESRRSTGKISLEGADIQLSDTEEAEDAEQTALLSTIESSHSTTSAPTTRPEISSISTLPKAVPSTTSLPLTSTSNTVGRFSSSRFNPDPTSVSPVKISNLSSRDRWSAISPSWQQSPNVRLSSYDSLSSGQNFRTGSTGTNSAALSIDYQKLWEQEKMENESLKKRTAQLERDLRNAQLQIEVSTPAKGFDRTDSREKRSTERKLAEVQEEKKLLEAKLASLDEELKKVESMKIENTKLKNENAALIRVISKLSK